MREKIEQVGLFTNPNLLLHGVHDRWSPRSPCLLEQILRMGLVTPSFLQRIHSDVKTTMNSVRNPFNQFFVSLARAGYKIRKEPWTPKYPSPFNLDSYQLVAGYADIIRAMGWMEMVVSDDNRKDAIRERYVFVVDPTLKVKNLDDSQIFDEVKLRYGATVKNEGECLRYGRVAPKYFLGVILPKNAGQEKVNFVARTMKKVFGNNRSLYFPIYNFSGQLLWPEK